MKSVCVLQSNYLPWKGYFDIIRQSDLFVVYDEVQYTKNDWRNRNQIKTAQGLKWLTVPVRTKGSFGAAIDEVQLVQDGWSKKHLRSIELNYRSTPYFDDYFPRLRQILTEPCDHLSTLNLKLLNQLIQWFKLPTQVLLSRDLHLSETDPSKRLAEVLKKTSAERYISGPAAKAYLLEDLLPAPVQYMDYSGYTTYNNQPHPPFTHNVSVIDSLFCVGPDLEKILFG